MPPRGLGSNLLMQKLLEAVSLALGRGGGGPGARKPRELALGWRLCEPWGQPRVRDHENPVCKGKEGGDGKRVASMGAAARSSPGRARCARSSAEGPREGPGQS